MRLGSFIKAIVFVVLLVAVIAVAIGLTRTSLAERLSAAEGQDSLFEQFFVAGGPIVWFVLLPMSLLMVYLVIEHGLTIRRGKLIKSSQTKKLSDLTAQGNLGKLAEAAAKSEDMVSTAVRGALAKGHNEWFRMRSVVAESLQEQASKLLRKIEWLNLIGGVSPMVGLFGTVLGMIKLFNAIVRAGGQPQPANLAEGISVALVTTFWGLAIAIPALAAHGVFRNKIETLTGDAVAATDDIMARMRANLQKRAKLNVEPAKTKFTKVPIVQIEKDADHDKKSNLKERQSK